MFYQSLNYYSASREVPSSGAAEHWIRLFRIIIQPKSHQG